MRHILILGLFYFLTPHSLFATSIINKTDTLKNLSSYAFIDKEGKSVSLEEFRGNYIYVDIWAMGCIPCLRQMPYINNLKEKYGGSPIKFVSICVDNNEPAWKEFIKRKNFEGIQFITKLDSPFIRENNFLAVPRFLLLDKSGNVIWYKARFPSDTKLQEEIDLLLTK